MNSISQADFARMMNVSRKTVTTWKKRGYIEVSGGLVNVDASLVKLNSVGRGLPTVVTAGAASVTGNSLNAEIAALYDGAGPHRDWVSTVTAMVDPFLVAELLLRHLPQSVVRSLVAEYVARSAKSAAEMLEEMGAVPPAEVSSWTDHPWFRPCLSDADWAEYQAVADEHGCAAHA